MKIHALHEAGLSLSNLSGVGLLIGGEPSVRNDASLDIFQTLIEYRQNRGETNTASRVATYVSLQAFSVSVKYKNTSIQLQPDLDTWSLEWSNIW